MYRERETETKRERWTERERVDTERDRRTERHRESSTFKLEHLREHTYRLTPSLWTKLAFHTRGAN